MNHFYVYILQCVDGLYYVGHTDNLETRVSQHEQGYITNCFTYKRRPVVLVWHQDFETRENAFVIEYRIKKWTRKKKEALIRGDWELLVELSRSQNYTDYIKRS